MGGTSSQIFGIQSVWKEARGGARALPVRCRRRICTEGARQSEISEFDTSATLNSSWNIKQSLSLLKFASPASFRAFRY
jgi:hypothetical protein